MPIVVTCRCDASYTLKDDLAGELVQCPRCGATNRVGSPTLTPASQADPAFDRDIFLLRQKHLSLNEKYQVADEQGRPILFVERPIHFLRNVSAVIAGIFAGMVVMGVMGGLVDGVGSEGLQAVMGLVTMLMALVTLFVVSAALSKERHVTFYRDERRTEQVLRVLQDSKWQVIVRTFTVRDDKGRLLAHFSKNLLSNILRKRWEVRGVRRELLFVAREDSIILSLLRRFLGPLFGFLRTNFVFQAPGSDRALGEFRRKMTILDRYVLDLSEDAQRTVDRRVALALGVMLDTGERR
ncbi:MAG TPA: hypothetical protein VFS05_16860 [Gemmatimonadaceae bacterium]|nr:hypothetical protein [Gemmatimonadaceae bacterium]